MNAELTRFSAMSGPEEALVDIAPWHGSRVFLGSDAIGLD